MIYKKKWYEVKKKFSVGPTQAVVKEILKKASGLLMQVT